MSAHYWAVLPKGYALKYLRIERALSAREATRLAFGGPIITPSNYRVKDLGTRSPMRQSDRKRLALLTDQTGWETLK